MQMTCYSLTASRNFVKENRRGTPFTRVPSTSSLDVFPGRLLVFRTLRIEPTDVRPAPERDRPTEGCQLAVLYLRPNGSQEGPQRQGRIPSPVDKPPPPGDHWRERKRPETVPRTWASAHGPLTFLDALTETRSARGSTGR